mgnify:CR=1 FL=1
MSEPLLELEVTSPTYDFDPEFQTKIAALITCDTSFMRQAGSIIEPAYMEDTAEAYLVALAQEHYEKYKMVPETSSTWVEVLKAAKTDKRIRDDIFTDVVSKFKELRSVKLTDRKFVIDKCSQFARHQAIMNAQIEANDLIEKGRFDDAQKTLEKAFRVSANDEMDLLDYWNDIERRTSYRKDVESGVIAPNGITTGIKKLDSLLYHKGWGRQELSVLMGGAKKGKSMGLGEFAVRASLEGKNVLYVSLEVSLGIISDRFDANLSSTEMNNLNKHISTVRAAVIERGSTPAPGKPSRGRLQMAEFPSGSLTPDHLRRIIEKEKSDGQTYDLIVVDYADIMSPNVYTNDAIENSKQIWLGLRAIAFEENCAVLTATQTNRTGHSSSVAKAEDVAEDFNKIRIADVVISINRDEEETARGEARLYFAASRNGAGDMSVQVKQDLAKGQFINAVMGVE